MCLPLFVKYLLFCSPFRVVSVYYAADSFIDIKELIINNIGLVFEAAVACKTIHSQFELKLYIFYSTTA